MCWEKGRGWTYGVLLHQVDLGVALQVVVHDVRGVGHHVDVEQAVAEQIAYVAAGHVVALGVRQRALGAAAPEHGLEEPEVVGEAGNAAGGLVELRASEANAHTS